MEHGHCVRSVLVLGLHPPEPPTSLQGMAVKCPDLRAAPRQRGELDSTNARLGHALTAWGRVAHGVASWRHEPTATALRPAVWSEMRLCSVSIGPAETVLPQIGPNANSISIGFREGSVYRSRFLCISEHVLRSIRVKPPSHDGLWACMYRARYLIRPIRSPHALSST